MHRISQLCLILCSFSRLRLVAVRTLGSFTTAVQLSHLHQPGWVYMIRVMAGAKTGAQLSKQSWLMMVNDG